jgi:hypothetical protein
MIVFAGCRKNNNISNEQKIYFQVDHILYTPEYQHYGYLVDSKGNILAYNNPQVWNFSENNQKLTEEQIEENISMCYNSGNVNPEDLARFASFISKIASSKITAFKDTGSENGSTSYICYEFGDDQYYHASIMKMEGDVTCENLNFYTKKVVLWMKELGGNLNVE